MIKLKTLSMTSPDVEVNVWEEGSDGTFFLLEIEIGEEGKDRADIFAIMIATPQGIKKNAKNKIISDRAMLIFAEFSWQILHSKIITIVQECSANSWNESVLKLQRYFRWEYEDYEM